ncbi:MAG: hypothetical protein RSI33_02775 [Clostridia bacterium]
MRKNKKKHFGIIAICVIPVFCFIIKELWSNIIQDFYNGYIKVWMHNGHYVFYAGDNTTEEFATFVEQAKSNGAALVSNIAVLGVYFIILLPFALGLYFIYRSKHSRVTCEKHEECIRNALKSLSNDNDVICGTQLYRYEQKTIGSKVNIAVNHVFSENIKKVNLNAVIHEEYELSKKTVKKINEFSTIYGEYEIRKDIAVKEKAISLINPIVTSWEKEFKSLKMETVAENHCTLFGIYKGINALIHVGDTWETPVRDCDPKVESILRSGKRIGCLPPIFLGNVQMFYNGLSRFKGNRIYLSFVPQRNVMPTGFKKCIVMLVLRYDKAAPIDVESLASELVECTNKCLKEYCCID